MYECFPVWQVRNLHSLCVIITVLFPKSNPLRTEGFQRLDGLGNPFIHTSLPHNLLLLDAVLFRIFFKIQVMKKAAAYGSVFP